MFCSTHTQRIALDRCQTCQNPLCTECARIIKGQTFCQSCSRTVGEGEEFASPRNPWAALFLSILLPGLGQAYNGQSFKAFLIFVSGILVVPWVYGVYDAFHSARKINRHEKIPESRPWSIGASLLVALLVWTTPFLVRNAIFHYRQMASIPAKQWSPVSSLKKMSFALESYAKKEGHYPQRMEDLLFAEPPYIEDIFCDREIEGFHFTCEINDQGYLIRAKTLSGKTVEEQSYSISTGGMLNP
jgi:hypothetical protein